MRVCVTMYDVGFGDCFLLSFHYKRARSRHVLIDCGSSSERKRHMEHVVDEIIADTGGHVDAVVATHRHRDHISAFGLKGLGEKLASLEPRVVVQPWTEHPEAEEGALSAPSVFGLRAAAHVKGLAAAQKLALDVTTHPGRVLAACGPRDRTQLARIASLSIPNKKAILQLTKMGDKHAYVYAGGPSGMERLLPGVRVTVLGPPTLVQSGGATRRQRSWDEDEFWKLRAKLAAAAAENTTTTGGRSVPFPRATTDSISHAPSHVKWLVARLNNAQAGNVRRIVRDLDRALNNTSVVLLFEVGSKSILFSGDAQLENWQYTLQDASIRRKLRGTRIYKVGHHGSTNATPKTLWNLFRRRNDDRKRLITLLSSEKGHHNKVPRESLLTALEEETELHYTQTWRRKIKETIEI